MVGSDNLDESAGWDMEMDEAAGWHMMLLGLAGRVSDDVTARCRELLAQGRSADLGAELAGAALAQGVAVFQQEIDFLTDVMDATDTAEAQLARLEVTDVGTPMRYGFADAPPDNVIARTTGDGADEAAIDATSRLPGARGLWRAWRLPTEGAPAQHTRRVYVVEADDDADLILATGEIQHALAAVGEIDPQVEVYPTGFELPSYQRFARAYGELLWSRTPDPGVRIAVLFDQVDPTLGPRFRPDHPTVDGDEWRLLVDYLRHGEPLLLTTARMDDVVDPARGNAVPMSFRTDGTWVWSDATTYYLDTHRLLPDPELAAHIRALGHIPPVVDDVARHRAMAKLKEPVPDEPAWTFGG